MFIGRPASPPRNVSKKRRARRGEAGASDSIVKRKAATVIPGAGPHSLQGRNVRWARLSCMGDRAGKNGILLTVWASLLATHTRLILSPLRRYRERVRDVKHNRSQTENAHAGVLCMQSIRRSAAKLPTPRNLRWRQVDFLPGLMLFVVSNALSPCYTETGRRIGHRVQ